MIDVKTVFLENDKEYFVIESIEIKNVTYKLFSNVEDEKDIKIRKIVVKDGDKYIECIDNDEELDNVILAFEEKLNSQQN